MKNKNTQEKLDPKVKIRIVVKDELAQYSVENDNEDFIGKRVFPLVEITDSELRVIKHTQQEYKLLQERLKDLYKKHGGW